tara:strand:- start:350 stop:1969 length:1620 start_codon:yes stop_codon:yes gene_type:complete
MALAVMNPGEYHKGYAFDRPPFNNSIYDPLKITEIRARTAIVANRRAYLGNVKVFYSDGSSEVLSDAMFKSEVGKFDKFKRSGRIDVAVDDGEHIIALAEYADRILQFKQRTLHILNVSQEIEYLEESHMHKGVDNRAAITRTDYGCAWVNDIGCYIYDGKSVRNILDKKDLRRIKSSTWSSFITPRAAIGYIPKERQLLVVGDMGDGTAGYFSSGGDGYSGLDGWVDAYLYDLVTDSWTYIKQRIIVNNGMSNFVTDFNNDLIYGYDTTGDVLSIGEWENVPSSTTALNNEIVLETKDFDFNDPGRDTFIYKLIVQYTGGAGQDVTIKYRTNGSGSYGTFSTTKLNYTTNPELITNGTFDTNTTGWTENLRVVATVNSQKLRVAANVQSGVNNGNAIVYQSFTTAIGETYRVTGNFIAGTDSGAKISVGKTDALGTGVYQGGTNTMTTNTAVDFTFIAVDTTQVVWLYQAATDDTEGEYHEWDNISIICDNDLPQTVEIKPSSTIKNIKSIQFQLIGTAAKEFILNDMTIIYREKSIG